MEQFVGCAPDDSQECRHFLVFINCVRCNELVQTSSVGRPVACPDVELFDGTDNCHFPFTQGVRKRFCGTFAWVKFPTRRQCCVLTLLVENRTEAEMGSRSELLLFISERKVGYTHTRKWRHASIE